MFCFVIFNDVFPRYKFAECKNTKRKWKKKKKKSKREFSHRKSATYFWQLFRLGLHRLRRCSCLSIMERTHRYKFILFHRHISNLTGKRLNQNQLQLTYESVDCDVGKSFYLQRWCQNCQQGNSLDAITLDMIILWIDEKHTPCLTYW